MYKLHPQAAPHQPLTPRNPPHPTYVHKLVHLHAPVMARFISDKSTNTMFKMPRLASQTAAPTATAAEDRDGSRGPRPRPGAQRPQQRRRTRRGHPHAAREGRPRQTLHHLGLLVRHPLGDLPHHILSSSRRTGGVYGGAGAGAASDGAAVCGFDAGCGITDPLISRLFPLKFHNPP